MTKKHLYKDLYICKWIKVYRPIQANGDCCCCLEFALPFFYYVKFTLAKPMRITLGKDKLERESNLLSRVSIRMQHRCRRFLMKSKTPVSLSRVSILRILKLLPKNEPHSPEYISVLIKHKKYDLFNIYIISPHLCRKI